MEDKYLQEKKEGFFSKIINFFKGIFKPEEFEEKNAEEENRFVNSIMENDSEKQEFEDYIKVGEKEDSESLKLQQQFEKNEIDLCVMSDEDLHELNALYKNQVMDLKKKVEDKKTELNILKNKLAMASDN